MAAADQTGPLERAWRAHYRALDDAALREARYIPPAGDAGPLLLVPTHYAARQREEAFGYAITMAWLGRLGWAALANALGDYEAVACAVERELEQTHGD